VSNPPSIAVKDEAELFDFAQGKLWIGFVIRSVRRHWKRALVTFLVVTALSSFLALSSPKVYIASTVMQALPDETSSKVVSAGSSSTSQPPAVLADATIRSQANLEKIVDELQLVKRYNINQGPVGKMKELIFKKIVGSGDDANKRRDLVSALRNSLNVATVANEQIKQTINVDITWNDPEQAKEILDTVNKNYLADVRLKDVGQFEVPRRVLSEKLDEQNSKVAKLRTQLGIPIDDERNLPESSPLRQELAIQSAFAQRFADADAAIKTAEGSFALRYATISPAEVPKAPVSGSLKSLIIGLLGGAILAAFVTTATDILSGKVVEPWQVARGMNLPLLAEIRN
jgi:hypothetical protein